MSELTLPGTIPGLLRRGSPAVRLPMTPVGGAVVDRDGWPCMIVECGEDVAAVAYSDGGTTLAEDDVPLADLALDLTDATGRAHAAWWVVDKDFGDAPIEAHMAISGAMIWGLLASPVASEAVELWPVLRTLDPADPRLLPDGSRLVDALALRLVVLHVAGVPHG